MVPAPFRERSHVGIGLFVIRGMLRLKPFPIRSGIRAFVDAAYMDT